MGILTKRLAAGLEGELVSSTDPRDRIRGVKPLPLRGRSASNSLAPPVEACSKQLSLLPTMLGHPKEAPNAHEPSR